MNEENDISVIWGETQRPKTDEILAELRQAERIEDFTRKYGRIFVDISFTDYLNSLLESKGLKRSAVISASGVSDSYAFQIFQGRRTPSRDKLIAMAVAMKLDLEECQRLLKLAGLNELYAKNRRDAIIIYGLEHKFSVPQLEDLMFDMEEFTLF